MSKLIGKPRLRHLFFSKAGKAEQLLQVKYTDWEGPVINETDLLIAGI